MFLVEKVRSQMPKRMMVTAEGKREEGTIQYEDGKPGQTVEDLEHVETALKERGAAFETRFEQVFGMAEAGEYGRSGRVRYR